MLVYVADNRYVVWGGWDGECVAVHGVWRRAMVTYYGILTHVSILPDNEILLLILARVDHVPHARHSERCLGDVGGKDAFPCSPGSGGEDAVLL
jgi:hypothetical protein